MRNMCLMLIGGIAFVSGTLFFAWYHGLLLIQPLTARVEKSDLGACYDKKTITLHYWHRDTWHKEEVEILWSSDQAISALHVARTWLNLLDEEGITSKKTSVQSALLCPSATELYLSFDRNPLAKQAGVYEKVMWVEGLLKTFNDNGLTFAHIHFLVHHQPINDAHLDFSQPWPGKGFLEHTLSTP